MIEGSRGVPVEPVYLFKEGAQLKLGVSPKEVQVGAECYALPWKNITFNNGFADNTGPVEISHYFQWYNYYTKKLEYEKY